MAKHMLDADALLNRARPVTHQHAHEIQPFGHLVKLPIALAQISRLLHAHEIVLKEARTMARRAAEAGDGGTNDLLVSDVIRSNELQVWFVAEHVVDMPLVKAV